MGRVAGLGGPPRLCHGLRGPRHGTGCPDKLPLDGHRGLKASPRHLLAGSLVTGTCEKSRGGSKISQGAPVPPRAPVRMSGMRVLPTALPDHGRRAVALPGLRTAGWAGSCPTSQVRQRGGPHVTGSETQPRGHCTPTPQRVPGPLGPPELTPRPLRVPSHSGGWGALNTQLTGSSQGWQVRPARVGRWSHSGALREGSAVTWEQSTGREASPDSGWEHGMGTPRTRRRVTWAPGSQGKAHPCPCRTESQEAPAGLTDRRLRPRKKKELQSNPVESPRTQRLLSSPTFPKTLLSLLRPPLLRSPYPGSRRAPPAVLRSRPRSATQKSCVYQTPPRASRPTPTPSWTSPRWRRGPAPACP